MKLYVLRVSKEKKQWRLRFGHRYRDPCARELITTVLITSSCSLTEALKAGALDAAKRFKVMLNFNNKQEE